MLALSRGDDTTVQKQRVSTALERKKALEASIKRDIDLCREPPPKCQEISSSQLKADMCVAVAESQRYQESHREKRQKQINQVSNVAMLSHVELLKERIEYEKKLISSLELERSYLSRPTASQRQSAMRTLQ